jgi:transposase
MGYKAGMDRTQHLMFPETLDDYVAADNEIRFVEAFVETLDMRALGFSKATPAPTGSPAYDPRMLLGLYIYGYLNQVRSSRLLEAEARRNLEVIWLLRRLKPSYKTIANFRKDHPEAIVAVCKAFTGFCKDLKLFGRQLVGIDGSKFKAVNSSQRNYTKKQVDELLVKVEVRIEEYLKALDEGDEREAKTPAVDAEELTAKIEAMRRRQEYLKALQKQMQESRSNQVSLTDADSRLMKEADGGYDVCYNVQIAVDAKHRLIVAHAVTNACNDQEQLFSMAEAARQELEVETLEVVADGGYNTEEQAVLCEEAGLVVHMPRAHAAQQERKGMFTKAAFTYLAEEDVYRCPAGEQLTYRYTEKKKGKEQRCYMTKACSDCPLRARCTTDPDGRRIRRSHQEWALEVIDARVRENPAVLRMRQSLVEHPFGTMKHDKGEVSFLLRGLRKVSGEFSLSVLTYNLRRVLNILTLPELMAALREWRASSARERLCPA